MSPRTVIVVPCYDEARRLDVGSFRELAEAAGDLCVLFVDDGSKDATRSLVEAAAAGAPDALAVLVLDHNRGKAEAVRRGMLAGLDMGAAHVGFLDADGATAPLEMLRLRSVLETLPADVVIGSRVLMLGRDIRRHAARHYIGRVLATFVSAVVLKKPVYDTQCGAKIFRRTPALEAALANPFLTGWVFDVELLGRLWYGSGPGPALPVGAIVEEPLLRWVDIPGTKIRPGAAIRSLVDLVRLAVLFGAARRRR